MTKTPKTTSAQRQAALRQRARSLAFGIEDDDIRSAPDTALLEALPIAYRLKQAAVVETIMVDLLRRLGVAVTVTHVKPIEELKTSAVTVTPDPPAQPVTVTSEPIEEKVEPKTRRSYPIEVQRLAVGMADEGKSSREIAAAIEDRVGRAPDVRNMAKLIQRWRSALG